MGAKKIKKVRYRRFCLLTGHELGKNDKLVPLSAGQRYFVDHKKKKVSGLCQHHAAQEAAMAQYRLRRTLEKP